MSFRSAPFFLGAIGALLCTWAFRAPWGGAWTERGDRYTFSLDSAAHVADAQHAAAVDAWCLYEVREGPCAPLPEGRLEFALLGIAGPAMWIARFAAIAGALLWALSRRWPSMVAFLFSVVFCAAAVALVVLAAPGALAVLAGRRIDFSGNGFAAAWGGSTALGFAAALAWALAKPRGRKKRPAEPKAAPDAPQPGAAKAAPKPARPPAAPNSSFQAPPPPAGPKAQGQ